MQSGQPVSRVKQAVFIALGLLCLGLSYIGIALPGVPAIPFLLLTVYFFVGSSPRLYKWMLRQRLIGNILRKIAANRTKTWFVLLVISQLWVSLIVADWLFVDGRVARIVLYSCGIAVSVGCWLLLRRPVASGEK